MSPEYLRELEQEIILAEERIKQGNLYFTNYLVKLYQRKGMDITEIIPLAFSIRKQGEKKYLMQNEDTIKSFYVLLTSQIDQFRKICPENKEIHTHLSDLEKTADSISEHALSLNTDGLNEDVTLLLQQYKELKKRAGKYPEMKNRGKFYRHLISTNRTIQTLKKMLVFIGDKNYRLLFKTS